MLTLLAFLGAITVLVFIHEFGHYWVARRCGVRVLRFSIGFGKVLYQRQRGDTEWVVSAIPLGGYVRMLDEREDAVPADLRHLAFNYKPVWQRMAIVAAGPLANFLLAIVLYWGVFIAGVPGLKPMLGDVPVGSPAALAQLQRGDTVQRLGDEVIPSWQELRWRLLDLALQQPEVQLTTRNSAGEERGHTLHLDSLTPADLDGDFLDKLGLRLYQPAIPPIIGEFAPNSVAQATGLRIGDEVQGLNEQPIHDWRDLVHLVSQSPEQTVRVQVRRGEQVLTFSLRVKAEKQGDKVVGKLGVGAKIDRQLWAQQMVQVRYDPLEAAAQAVRKTWETSLISLKMFGKMLLGEVSVKNLSGPVTIADYAGQSARLGWTAYLGFLALISISLGVLNLLPVPLLDGGHLLYYAAEWIKGSPVSERAWELGQKIGIALIGTLMCFALYNDFSRLFSG